MELPNICLFISDHLTVGQMWYKNVAGKYVIQMVLYVESVRCSNLNFIRVWSAMSVANKMSLHKTS